MNVFYADAFQMIFDPWGGCVFEFASHSPGESSPPGPQQPTPIPTVPQVGVGMSVAHAKVMVYMMARHLIKREESQFKDITVPDNMLQGFKIDKDEWGRFWGTPAQGPSANRERSRSELEAAEGQMAELTKERARLEKLELAMKRTELERRK